MHNERHRGTFHHQIKTVEFVYHGKKVHERVRMFIPPEMARKEPDDEDDTPLSSKEGALSRDAPIKLFYQFMTLKEGHRFSSVS